ncbi:MAG: NosD domain-containing protein [Candidatus Odinarchaeota archaeon]
MKKNGSEKVVVITAWLIVAVFAVSVFYLPGTEMLDSRTDTDGRTVSERFLELRVIAPVMKMTGIATLEDHDPIVINGDDDFIPENGVINRSGTEEDPHIIANYYINSKATGDNCIKIASTTEHFIIENCTLVGATRTDNAGIFLQDVVNGYVRNNVCNYSYAGIILNSSCFYNTFNNNTCNKNTNSGIVVDASSSYNVLTDNICSNNTNSGINLIDSFSNTLSGNNCSNNTNSGIVVDASSSYNVLTDNICSNNTNSGINLIDSFSNTLSGNNCSNNDDGILLVYGNSNNLSRNNCSSNNNGIWLGHSIDNILSGNNCSSNNYGIWLDGCLDNAIILNILAGNTVYAITISISSPGTGNNIHSNWIWDNTNTFGGQIAGTYIYDKGNYVHDNFFFPPSKQDSDHDGLVDELELLIGTSPIMVDTDGDNFLDGYEYVYGTNPLDSNIHPVLWQEEFDQLVMDLEGNVTLVKQVIGWLDGNASVIGELFAYLEGNASQLVTLVSYLDGNVTLLETVYALATGNGALLQQLNTSQITQFEDIRAVIDLLGITVGDTDYDGLSDLDELTYGTSIVLLDTDCDNLNDAFEVKIGTDPLDDDTDGDGHGDGLEVLAGTDPLDILDYPGKTSSSPGPLEIVLLAGVVVLLSSSGIVIYLKKFRGK